MSESAKSTSSNEDHKGSVDALAVESEVFGPWEPQGRREVSGKLSAGLVNVIPVAEIYKTTTELVVSQIVNVKEGYIHVLRLAEMIAESLQAEASLF